MIIAIKDKHNNHDHQYHNQDLNSNNHNNHKQSGGKLLDQGSYGCVYLTDNQKKRNKFVSKLMSIKHAIKEMKMSYEVIKRTGEYYDKYYAPIVSYNHLYKNNYKFNNNPLKQFREKKKKTLVENFKKENPAKNCDVYKSATNPEFDFILVHIPFIKGKTMREKIYDKIYDAKTDDDFDSLHCFITSCESHLQTGVTKLSEAGIVHYDMHSQNVFYNDITENPVILDFGLSFLRDDLKKKTFESDDAFYGRLRDFLLDDYEYRITWWCPEIKYVGHILRRETNFTLKQAEEEARKIFTKNERYSLLASLNLPKTIFDYDAELQKLIDFFKSMSKLSKMAAIKKLTSLKYVKTWDTYSKAGTFLRFYEEEKIHKKQFDKLLVKMIKEYSIIPEDRL